MTSGECVEVVVRAGYQRGPLAADTKFVLPDVLELARQSAHQRLGIVRRRCATRTPLRSNAIASA